MYSEIDWGQSKLRSRRAMDDGRCTVPMKPMLILWLEVMFIYKYKSDGSSMGRLASGARVYPRADG